MPTRSSVVGRPRPSDRITTGGSFTYTDVPEWEALEERYIPSEPPARTLIVRTSISSDGTSYDDRLDKIEAKLTKIINRLDIIFGNHALIRGEFIHLK